ncbi:MAG: ROK family protein [Deltaproteobacteria bacterium]|nr:ROK family protein [Candidatus Zymogenaceae bacterium]
MAHGYNIDKRKRNKRNHIIDLFRKHQILSKARAREESGYSMDTIISVFNGLVDDGLIVPTRGEQKQKGRRATFYRLEDGGHTYLGVTFNRSGIYSVLVGLSGTPLFDHTSRIDSGSTNDAFAQLFRDHLDRVTHDARDRSLTIRAAGAAVPGDLDETTGVLRSYTFMPRLSNLDIFRIIEASLPGVDTVVEQNVTGTGGYLLHDEELIGRYRRILFVSVHSGAASGLLYDGNIVTGHGEFGHIRVSDEEKRCVCGRRGCLDLYFSHQGFLQLYREAMGRAGEEGVSDIEPDDLIETLRDAFAEGGKDLARALRRRLGYFVSALLDVVNVTAPDAVVLTGSLFRAYPDPYGELLSVIGERFEDTGFITHFANTDLIYRDMGPEIAAMGGAYRLVDRDWGYIREDRRPRRRGERPASNGRVVGGNT